MGNPMFEIITGLSGAGKKLANGFLQDLGYFCVDNLPPRLIPMLADLCTHSKNPKEKVALVLDIREEEFFDELFDSLDKLGEHNVHYRILFLTADDHALVKRFNETRRRHPLSRQGTDLIEAIRLEKTRLGPLHDRATAIINTTDLSPSDLRDELSRLFGELSNNSKLLIKIMSFGFRFGIPSDADLVFDVRFLRNPNYVESLKELNGTSTPVKNYVTDDATTQTYLEKLFDLIAFSVPQYIKEGKSYLSIAVGCTGGQHRSVVIAEELAAFLELKNSPCLIHHRDIERTE